MVPLFQVNMSTLDAVREWYGLGLPIVCTVVGGGITWFIATRTQWFKSNTAKAEEEAKQAKARSQAFAAATIEAIKAGDASAYGTMLKWMEGQLVEQSSQHQAVRVMLQSENITLRNQFDLAQNRIGGLIEDVAELQGKDLLCQAALAEHRLQVTQQSLIHRQEQGVLNRRIDSLNFDVKELKKEIFRLDGDPTKSIVHPDHT